jgi:hypothetical protein
VAGLILHTVDDEKVKSLLILFETGMNFSLSIERSPGGETVAILASQNQFEEDGRRTAGRNFTASQNLPCSLSFARRRRLRETPDTERIYSVEFHAVSTSAPFPASWVLLGFFLWPAFVVIVGSLAWELYNWIRHVAP